MIAIGIRTGAAAVATTKNAMMSSEPQSIPAQSRATTAVTIIHRCVVIDCMLTANVNSHDEDHCSIQLGTTVQNNLLAAVDREQRLDGRRGIDSARYETTWLFSGSDSRSAAATRPWIRIKMVLARNTLMRFIV